MLRKVLVVLAASAMAMNVAHARTSSGGAAGPQSEKGSVVLPGPSPNAGEGCWQGHARRAYLYSMGATSGPAGSVIEIDESTWGGKFKLTVAGGQMGSEDLDVHFFISIGTVDPVNDPAGQNVVQSSSYATVGPGGEGGLIPPETKYAIVCLVPGSGFNAAWEYKGSPPKKK